MSSIISTFDLCGWQVRALVGGAGVNPDDARSLQEWFEDHQNYRMRQLARVAKALADGRLSPSEWHELTQAGLIEGHANSWFIGRVWAAGGGDFNADDLMFGNQFADDEADFLLGFLDDIRDGRYLTDEGDFKWRAFNNRLRLYVGKMRGTVGLSHIENSPSDLLWTWHLGGAEMHCSDCPALAAQFIDVSKEFLTTAPGAGDTPCLGNCTCRLSSKAASGVVRPSVRLYTPPIPDYDQIAA